MTKSFDLVTDYFAACTYADAQAIASCFCADAIVYDTNHRPVRGAEAIGKFYVKVRKQWAGAIWHIDTFVGDATGAASEWTMIVRHNGKRVAVRGSEHYEFREARIRQIRQYWTYDPKLISTALLEYPYEDDKRFIAT